MSEIDSISSALQSSQLRVQNEISMYAVKKAAEAEQALADMILENARTAAAATQKTAKGGISIYA